MGRTRKVKRNRLESLSESLKRWRRGFRLLPSVHHVQPEEPYDDPCLADVHHTPQMPVHHKQLALKPRS